MPVTFSQWFEVQFTAGVWTDITSDVRREGGQRISYGIRGNRPQDCVAGTGECQLSLKNDKTNSGGVFGYYSPSHGSKRTGWTFGVPAQMVFAHQDDSSTTVTITRSSQTATVTHTSHGKATGEYVKISGANQAEYNGTWQITNTGANTYTYTVAGSPATPATGTISSRKAYVKHRGRVHVIDPDPGVDVGDWEVRVTSYDGMRELAEAELREVDLLTDVSESAALTEILDAVPAVSQPVARDIDPGIESFAYVFDDMQGGTKALGVIYDVALSAYMLVAMKGDGTLIALNHSSRATAASQFTFTNTMHGLSVPLDLGNVYNDVRLTIHKRSASVNPDEELFSLESAIAIAPSTTEEVWTNYSDPNDRQTAVGGTAIVTTLVAGTHYQAFSSPVGGVDLTSSLTPTLTPFASTAKWALQNTSATDTIYVTVLKVIGKALRDPGPETYTASSVQSYGTRTLKLDLRYLSNGNSAAGYAALLENMFNDLQDQVLALEINGNYSSDFLRQALAREPGDVITVSETLTGVSTEAVIHSVDIDVSEVGVMTCRWGLAPPAPDDDPWVLDVDQLGTGTILGTF